VSRGRAGFALLAAAIAVLGLSGGPAVAAPSPASLSVQDCTEAHGGDSFDLEIRVAGVSGLAAWEVYFAYDPSILEVTGKNVRLFLAQRANSNVFDFSDPVPNSDGLYRLGAADLGMGDTAESGSGVLARITLRAKAKGVSPAAIYRGDVNGDTVLDLGPTLTGVNGVHIDDADGNGIFDGPIASGQVAVDRRCVEPPPTPNPPSAIIIAPTVAATATPGVDQPSTHATGAPTQTPVQAPARATPAPAQSPTFVLGGSPGDNTTGDSGGARTWAIVAGILAAAGGLATAALLLLRWPRRVA